MAALLRSRHAFRPPEMTVDHLVVGAGVVGLAIAERLTKAFVDRTTFVVERRGAFGEETSSRNSEVIHSGIYYPANSLKTSLCIRGRDLLYKRCSAAGIAHRKTGKLILANSSGQVQYLEGLKQKASKIEQLGVGRVPLEWLSGDEVREREPDVSKGVVGALLSPETGIVSSHELMEDLEKSILDSELGELVYGTKVVRIDRVEGKSGGKRGDGTEDGWVVQTLTDDGKGGEGERSAVLAKTLINAAGLNAHHIANQILPASDRIQLHFAKGSYFSYRGPGISSVRHLLYPCPDPSSLAGLGTHLTMNLDNEIRFGPDVEWLKPPVDEKGEDLMDFWEQHLAVNEERRLLAIEEVRKFLPNVVEDGFQPDYVGIRPKISAKGAPAVDFSIAHPLPGFINLTGIESPGLTSSLAIAEMVEAMIRQHVGLGRGRGKVISEAGSLDAWA
ncbi:FAD dependent oxidoreductase [Leucosporidium creatinivorum]|uniref:L-2-hydroxyglutarate dehydrogenase, mitochondrial n=1 Tax=Leucosporidium creatinivorum TaxID=106004 RepID=A0A1Y2FYT7_9BASI|nr:FAD dependent oxidoreductase [Leucosporidium creatinivorum]